jgi:hypothetical protein
MNGKHDGGKLMERNSQLIDAFNNNTTMEETRTTTNRGKSRTHKNYIELLYIINMASSLTN